MSETTFAKFGTTFQEKTVQSLLTDHLFAEQVADVMDPKFFEPAYLQVIAAAYFDHKRKFNTYPSIELMENLLQDAGADDITMAQAVQFIRERARTPLNGDSRYIQSKSADFCKRQALGAALLQAAERLDTPEEFDSILGIVREATVKGCVRDLGSDYHEGFAKRAKNDQQEGRISTGWPIIDGLLNGGYKRKKLVTFIAPTGAGKSMFLVNAAAAACAQGCSVFYGSLELAEDDIGLRFDAYYSGVAINDIKDNTDVVEAKAREKATGRLMIKEWPTKSATVQTIRSHLQKLEATKNFRPDVIIIDYADLLRSSRQFGEKRHELESVYEELRGLAQEFNAVVITADQTNRGGLNEEVVTLNAIAECYAKATVCDLIMTISRTIEDKLRNMGRLFVAKSRLGRDGVIYNFHMDTAFVKATVLDQTDDPQKYLDELKAPGGVQTHLQATLGKYKGPKKPDGDAN